MHSQKNWHLFPGWGEKKVKAWVSTVREPFRVKRAGKSNIGLLRKETTVGSESEAMNRPTSSHKAIPISIAPVSRQNTVEEAAAAQPEDARGPSKIDEFTYDDIDDDEEAALLAAVELDTSAQTKAKDHGQKSVRKEPELSEGVMAALARLRET